MGPQVQALLDAQVPPRVLTRGRKWGIAQHSLVDVCRSGGSVALRLALTLDPAVDVGLRDSHGDSLLDRACEGDQVAVAEVLVQAGASVDDVHPMTQRSPLHLASARACTAIVEWLLDAGCQTLSTGDVVGHIPLDLACFAGHLRTAQVLVTRGARIHAPGRHAEGPLFHAIAGGSENVVAWLQDQGAEMHPKQAMAALQVGQCYRSFFHGLKSLQVNPDTLVKSTEVHQAANTGSYSVMLHELESNSTPKAKPRCCLPCQRWVQ